MNERIKQLRKALNLKQSDFATALSISQGHLSDIENNRKKVSDRVLSICSLKFGVNKEWLRTGKGNMYMFLSMSEDDEFVFLANRVAAGISERDSFCKELFIALSKLSDDELNALKKFIFLMKQG